MEFPGTLGVILYRLRTWMRDSPTVAIGPLVGFIAADLAVDLSFGRYGSAGIGLVMAPLIVMSIVLVAGRPSGGITGMLLLGLGLVSVLAASSLLVLGMASNTAGVVIVGLRHLVVGAYAWAAIADEPPRRRVAVVPAQH